MTLLDPRRVKRDEILRIANGYGALGRGLAATRPLPATSNFLVDLDPERTLMDLGGLLTELQEMLGMQVDVATPGMLRPKVREDALRDAVPL